MKFEGEVSKEENLLETFVMDAKAREAKIETVKKALQNALVVLTSAKKVRVKCQKALKDSSK